MINLQAALFLSRVLLKADGKGISLYTNNGAYSSIVRVDMDEHDIGRGVYATMGTRAIFASSCFNKE